MQQILTACRTAHQCVSRITSIVMWHMPQVLYTRTPLPGGQNFACITAAIAQIDTDHFEQPNHKQQRCCTLFGVALIAINASAYVVVFVVAYSMCYVCTYVKIFSVAW